MMLMVAMLLLKCSNQPGMVESAHQTFLYSERAG
jgi:hypothetical protein